MVFLPMSLKKTQHLVGVKTRGSDSHYNLYYRTSSLLLVWGLSLNAMVKFSIHDRIYKSSEISMQHILYFLLNIRLVSVFVFLVELPLLYGRFSNALESSFNTSSFFFFRIKRTDFALDCISDHHRTICQI